jgi:hypothetical protein
MISHLTLGNTNKRKAQNLNLNIYLNKNIINTKLHLIN